MGEGEAGGGGVHMCEPTFRFVCCCYELHKGRGTGGGGGMGAYIWAHVPVIITLLPSTCRVNKRIVLPSALENASAGFLLLFKKLPQIR